MRVERRDVDALELRRLAQKFLLAQTLPLGCAVAFDDLAGALLPFADGEKVDEIGQRLRVYRADAPGEDNALQPLAVFGQQRQSGKLKHVEHVRVAHLVAEREGDEVKIADRVVAHADVRHADLIRIREAERHAHVDVLFPLYDLVVFSAHVARRLLHAREYPVDLICHGRSFSFVAFHFIVTAAGIKSNR